MIISKTTDNKYKDTYKTESTKFKISEKNQRHIIHMLRDQIYQDKIMAPIREYCCNAFDANIEAGRKDPIIVKLPDSINPIWSVKDQGKGLSPKDIKEVFTQYGESTKRQSNDVTGCLGIGSKSFFAYTDQFTIESWWNGIKYTYICALNDENDAIVKLVSTKKTPTLVSGVRISAPVMSNDINEFNEKTRKYLNTLSLTDSKYIIVNDIEKEKEDLILEKRYSNTYEKDLDWWLVKLNEKSQTRFYASIEYGNAKVIMGHVAYEIDPDQLVEHSSKIENSVASTPSLHIRVPIGAVSITASRESLEYNKQTKAYLSTILPKIGKSIQKTIGSEIINAEDIFKASQHYNTAMQTLPFALSKLLDGIQHGKTKENIKGTIGLYLKYKDDEGAEQKKGMTSFSYEMRTLRNGTEQVKRSSRQYVKPCLDTHLFIDNKTESKTKVGRRVKAWMHKNKKCKMILIKHRIETLKDSTISNFLEKIPLIQTIEPEPINYSRKGSHSSGGVSKAVDGLFKLDLEKLAIATNMNRSMFEPTKDDSTTIDGVEQLAIEVNGFRYAGKDFQIKSSLPTNATTVISNFLKKRYDFEHTVVAYRPKHAYMFKHLRRFWDVAKEEVNKELTKNPNTPYELMLMNTDMRGDVCCADEESHELWDILDYLKDSNRTWIKKLTKLKIQWSRLQIEENKELLMVASWLGLDMQKYTKRKTPDIDAIVNKMLKDRPILRYIKTPYFYRYSNHNKSESSIMKRFKETLASVIK